MLVAIRGMAFSVLFLGAVSCGQDSDGRIGGLTVWPIWVGEVRTTARQRAMARQISLIHAVIGEDFHIEPRFRPDPAKVIQPLVLDRGVFDPPVGGEQRMICVCTPNCIQTSSVPQSQRVGFTIPCCRNSEAVTAFRGSRGEGGSGRVRIYSGPAWSTEPRYSGSRGVRGAGRFVLVALSACHLVKSVACVEDITISKRMQ
jgi:hypothetical protein